MTKKRSKKNKKLVPGNNLGDIVGLRGGFKKLRVHWNEEKQVYDRYEECWGAGPDGQDLWEPRSDGGNVASLRFIGGPRNGEVDW